MLHEGVLWFIKYLGVHRHCLWLLVFLWSLVFLHDVLKFYLLVQSRGDFLIVVHLDFLITGCQYWGW